MVSPVFGTPFSTGLELGLRIQEVTSDVNHMALPRRAYRKAVTPETASRLARRPSAPLRLVRSPLLPHAALAQRAYAVMCRHFVPLVRDCVVAAYTAAKILRAVIRSVIIDLTARAAF